MNRITVVQRALAGRADPVYLEVGVSRGAAFRRIAAHEKIAVDPRFRMTARTRRRADAQAAATHYFPMTSDEFFATRSEFLERRGIDVALIDGLHTYEQVMRDVDHTRRHLRDDGIVVLHDCNPRFPSVGRPAGSYAEYRAATPWWKARFLGWSGDVWKAIVHLRSTRDDLRVAVLDCDFGVGILRRGTPDSRLSCSVAQIAALTYEDLAADREQLLNLRPPAYLDDFLGSGSRPVEVLE